jgi:phosphatidylserine/phosphatidylglycerophosphate/cardiolipin synthase-like enzyme
MKLLRSWVDLICKFARQWCTDRQSTDYRYSYPLLLLFECNMLPLCRCYGRWDTSQHVMTDEDHTAESGPDGPVWRGKDYANERVAEFANLDKPFEDTFDRSKVPRMPWHDVGLQIVGQPARDLARHFVQRWNMLIRTKVSLPELESSGFLLIDSCGRIINGGCHSCYRLAIIRKGNYRN